MSGPDVSSAQGNQIDWRSLAGIALRGLHTTYGESDGLPHTVRLHRGGVHRSGQNVRYALIALIGLARAKRLVGSQERLRATLAKRIAKCLQTTRLSIGDQGLLMWAQALNTDLGPTALRAGNYNAVLAKHSDDFGRAGSIELSWLLIGSQRRIRAGIDEGQSDQITQRAADAVMSLYRPQTALFARHQRPGFTNRIAGRIACFANQVYSLMALAERASWFACEQAAAIVGALSAKLVALQGEKGQWWWLYDSQTGEVVERYPVFSVHQDGMAPMALLAAARALECNFDSAIRRSVQWIYGNNELGQNLVLDQQGLILRDLHPPGASRLTRAIKAAAWCSGWRADNKASHPRCVINAECRPYHLGWVLCAAGMAAERESRTQSRALEEAVA
jgi:hypothetical protein